MRILLADPPRKEQYYDLSYPNIGILYLISYLREHFQGELEVRYLEGQASLDDHLAAIAEFKPDIYGISFALWTARLAQRTINQVKERYPSLITICGGPQPTAAHEQVMADSAVDYCCLGEGEQTFLEFAQTVARGEQVPADVAGLARRGQGGEISLTPKRSFIKELDDIPLPAWDLVDFAKYPGMHIHQAIPQTHILVSRGCPFDCNFCANAVWKYNKPWVRLRSPANIALEVELLYQRGIREIYMTSDEFNVTEKWALEVCAALEKLGHQDLYFQCNIRADRVSPELARAFKRINLWMVHLGIESGNQRTLDGIGKHVTLEQVERACTHFQEAGLSIFGFVMLFHAWEEDGRLTWETPEDVDQTFRFCRRLLSKKLIDYMSWQVATPMPGSRLWQTARKHNLIPDKVIEDVWSQNMLLPGVCESQVKAKLRKGMLLKNFYLLKNGKINLRHVDRIGRNLRVLLGGRLTKA
jgi:radical SAM superfamily enzyme YgiQ (UPF0313 family)